MNEPLTALLAGGVLGVIFFGGLWWTILKGMSSQRPAFWFFGSLLLRMGIALGGFYVIAGGHWQRLLLCLIGFVMGRAVVTRLTGQARDKQTHSPQEASHASQSR